MGIFDRYAPFVQDFIYRNRWESLRAIQVAAGDAVFNTDENVLLSASTASGKTEAAFFPILTLIFGGPAALGGRDLHRSAEGADQRPVFPPERSLRRSGHPGLALAWRRGAVAQKQAAAHPSGILQITPESLEALLMHKHVDVGRLFGDLRFVVIDEVHSLMRGDRGGQTLCLIERLSRLAG